MVVGACGVPSPLSPRPSVLIQAVAVPSVPVVQVSELIHATWRISCVRFLELAAGSARISVESWLVSQ